MKFLKIVSIYISLMLLTVSGCDGKRTGGEVSYSENEQNEVGVRPAISGGNSAAYFSYINPLDVADTLIYVHASKAELTQLHESFKTEDGLMGMREQKNVVVQPADTIIFKQGGLHIMLIQLREDLNAGDSVKIELGFSKAGVVTKEISVKN